MNHFWRNIAAFTQREQRGAIVFIIIILIIIGINQGIPYFIKPDLWYTPNDTTWINQWKENLQPSPTKLSLHNFDPNTISAKQLTAIGVPSNLSRRWRKYVKSGGRFYKKNDLLKLYGFNDTLFARLEPFIQINNHKKRKPYFYTENNNNEQPNKKRSPFNPNTDSRTQLLQSGLKPYIVKTILNYRKAGGEFKTKKDLLQLYTIDTPQYVQLEPYINLPETSPEIITIDSIELNSATKFDFLQIQIPNFVADKIIKYRNMLGGYYNFNQLHEVYNIDTLTLIKIKKSAWIDTILIHRININKVNVKEMFTHPYISRQQARQIKKYREFVTQISTAKEIKNLGIIEPTLFEKLKPYLEF